MLIDGRSAAERAAGDALRRENCTEQAGAPNVVGEHALAKHGRNEVSARSRFADVVKVEHAKQALMQLGFKARAARAAIDSACAHVGADADVATIVKTVLQHQREAARQHQREAALQHQREAATAGCAVSDIRADARQALRQLGFPSAIADAAVDRAIPLVGPDVDLPGLIEEALRWCG